MIKHIAALLALALAVSATSALACPSKDGKTGGATHPAKPKPTA